MAVKTVSLCAYQSFVAVYGQTGTDSDLSYASNQVTITNNVPASSAGSNDASGTVRVHSIGVRLAVSSC